jgi:hypothetical protein
MAACSILVRRAKALSGEKRKDLSVNQGAVYAS